MNMKILVVLKDFSKYTAVQWFLLYYNTGQTKQRIKQYAQIIVQVGHFHEINFRV